MIGSFIALFRLLAASQIVLATVGFALSDNPKRVKFVLICLCLGMLSYFLAPLVHPAPLLLFLLVSGFANAIPMFLWATCRFFFNDDLSLPSGWLLLAAMSVALVLIADVRAAQLGALEGAQWWLLRVVPQLIKLAFTVLAIRTAWVGREVDLVTPRRRARRWFALAVAIIVIAVVVTEIATGFQVPPWLEGLGMLAMFCAAIALNLTVFRLHPVFELSHQPTPEIPPKGTQEDPLLIALETLMAEERIYADHDVRIGSLAHRLGVAEHKLRSTINGKLGYRNFNQYVNHYRSGVYPSGNLSWHHFWFLIYLFLFCLIALPVFRHLQATGAHRVTRLQRFMRSGVNLYLPIVPLAALSPWLGGRQVARRVHAPAAGAGELPRPGPG